MPTFDISPSCSPSASTRHARRRPFERRLAPALLAHRLRLGGQRVDGGADRRCAAGQGRAADVALDAVVGEHLHLDLAGHVGVVAQVLLGVLASLTDAIALEAEPGARLLDRAALGAEVDQIALVADPLAVEDVELDL